MHDRIALDSRASWLRLGVSLLVGIVGNVGMWAVILIMPAMQAEFGIDRADATLPYTVTMVGFALGNFQIGRAVDRFGMAVALTGAAILIAAGYGLAAASGSMILLTAAHFAIGFGTAASFGPLIADVSQWFLKRRGIAVALVASGNYLSGAIWPVALSGLLESDGWRAVYLFLAALTLAVVIPLALLLRRGLPEDLSHHTTRIAAERAATTGLSPRALQWLLALAGVGCCVAMSMPQVHIVAYCVDLGFGQTVGAEMLSLMLLGGVASRVASGLLADVLGGVRTLLIGSALQAVALVLYLPSAGLTSLYVVSLIFGLSQGGIVPSYAVIVREYLPAREAGARVGFVMMATIIGMALGGWMSGWIYDLTGSYQIAFVNGIAWNLLNLGIVLMILLRSRPRLPAVA
ncbi:putative MFS-type transporter YhjX [Defluviimonas aquaemixtae]|uniref:Putative MFS-type transporter YhjX n=1 Tax=Albidovulum aquaemixtae TaxID=1542388 RepID=A0A2R8B1R8_9RHOB|nr:MFS transporter [Defluviimonas aquaemixtae]SPH16569.1 putative MFS-type transporter YhjX [Defluviimonas aquaemixtae]